MQNIPVELALSQSADPHAQLASSFAEVPSVILQDEDGREQVLDAAVHTKPVPFPPPLLVHAVLPQMQGELSSALLGADPSVILQARAVRVQMHVSSVEQDSVEEVSVLKDRESEEYS